MRHAIEKSCNVYFYTLGKMLGVDRIHKWATASGSAAQTGIDLPNEIQGLMPSTEWKKRVRAERGIRAKRFGLHRAGPGRVTPLSLA